MWSGGSTHNFANDDDDDDDDSTSESIKCLKDNMDFIRPRFNLFKMLIKVLLIWE